jgi:DNA-binding response OmpR family regulator
VHTHSDGASAAQRVRSLPPELVILDVMLPGRSGFDILQDLRADPATAVIPVMMLTARSQSRDRDLAMRLGATRFLAKPFSNAEVVEAVRELVGT